MFSFLPSLSEVFCDSQRNILKENDIVRFPKLAETYQRIAEEGPDVFYNGAMAQNIVEDIQAAGALLYPHPLLSSDASVVTPPIEFTTTLLYWFQVVSSPWKICWSTSPC